MDVTLLQQAVDNNAAWCDAVCRAHGRPGTFHPAIWSNQQQTPRFYPNAITLSPSAAAEQREMVQQIKAARAGSGMSVKDSFAALELGELGLRVLFEATWIGRPAGGREHGDELPGATWRQVGDPEELAVWERAWGGADHEAAERIFVPALLADADVAILAAYRGETIVAGAIASRAAGVVGLSNLFAPAGEEELAWAGCVGVMQRLFPGLAIVGYEHGAELERALALGFVALGPLRVWVG